MRRSILFLGLCLVALLVLVRAIDPLPVQALRSAYFDYLQVLSPRDYQDLPVRVVDVDERSLAEHGQWPWPRNTMAELVDRLNGYGAAVIAFDVLFAEPDRYSPSALVTGGSLDGLLRDGVTPRDLSDLDTDRQFADAIARAPVVLGVASVPGSGVEAESFVRAGLAEIGNRPGLALFPFTRSTTLVPVLDEAALGVGNINVSPVLHEGRIRQVPLLWRTQDGLVASLSLESLRVAMGQSTYILRGLGDLDATVESVQLGGYIIPTTDRGELWVRYRQDDPRLYVSAADVLARTDPERLAAALQGQIVLVGTSAAGLLDIRMTALGESVPGVSIHAQIIEQILLETYLMRDDFIAGMELLLVALLGLLVTAVMARAGPTLSLVSGAVAAGCVLGVSWWAFSSQSILLDVTYPLFGGAINFGLLTGWRFIVTDREKRKIRRSFAQYLAPSVLQQIEGRGFHVELGGEIREITVMFADIRNFTPLTERTPADDLVPMLNELFTDLSQQILDRAGTIDKFIGDSVMAFWNAPLPIGGHQRLAALAALQMRQALRSFVDRRADIPVPIEIGVGLHSGEACVGNIGSNQRFNYSALGEAVNIAARVESSCKEVGFDIIGTADVQAASPGLAWLPAGAPALKGVGTRKELFILVGDEKLAGDDRFLELRVRHEALIAGLAAGAADAADISACRVAGEALLAKLGRFYDRLPERIDDLAGIAPSYAEGEGA